MSLIKNVGLMVVSHTQQGCVCLQQARSRYSKQGCEDRMVRLEEVFGSSICSSGVANAPSSSMHCDGQKMNSTWPKVEVVEPCLH